LGVRWQEVLKGHAHEPAPSSPVRTTTTRTNPNGTHWPGHVLINEAERSSVKAGGGGYGGPLWWLTVISLQEAS
jgi:hypothetical protein